MFQIFERKHYQLGHHEIASFTALFFDLIRGAEKGIYYYPEPYFIKQHHQNSYQLAVLLNVAFTLGMKKPGAPIVLSTQQLKMLLSIGIHDVKLKKVFKLVTQLERAA